MKIFAIVLALILLTPVVQVYASTIEIPTVNAHGAVLIEAETGRILWGKNEHEPLAMASTTKIMTAILALESGRENETVTVSATAASAPRMKMFLTKGEEIRLGDLMLALMLESSNDAAVAIAEHLAGSVQEFCRHMTDKAISLGAVNTVYETASGLDAGNHHSTPFDLALIARYALTVPGFIELTNTSSASFTSSTSYYTMHNKNRLLQEFPGANGVKTGFTNKAGHCFVGAAKQDGMQLISVVLASGWGAQGRNQKWVDTKEILSYGFANFEFETIITGHTHAGDLPITRSRTRNVGLEYSYGARVPINKNEDVTVQLYFPVSMQAPVATGDTVGSARIYIGSEFYQEIPLAATESASRHDFKTSLERIINTHLGLFTKSKTEITLPEFFAFPKILPPT